MGRKGDGGKLRPEKTEVEGKNAYGFTWWWFLKDVLEMFYLPKRLGEMSPNFDLHMFFSMFLWVGKNHQVEYLEDHSTY